MRGLFLGGCGGGRAGVECGVWVSGGIGGLAGGGVWFLLVGSVSGA